MRRWLRRFRIAIPLLALLLALGLWAWGWPHRVTQANFDRIELGMTRAQVDEVLPQGPRKVVVGGVVGTGIEIPITNLLYSDKEPNGFVPTNIIRVNLQYGKVTYKEFHPWTFADLWGRLKSRADRTLTDVVLRIWPP
jgi:hypothetical protein